MTTPQQTENEQLQLGLEFKYQPTGYIFDLTIRIFLFYLYVQHYVPTWLFITLQLSLLVVQVILNVKYIEKLKKNYYPIINQKYASDKLKLSITESIPEVLMSIQAIFGFIFSYWFFYHIIENHGWYMHILFFLLASFGTIIFIVSVSVTVQYKKSKGIISYKVEKLTTYSDKDGKIVIDRIDLTKQYPDVLLSKNNHNNNVDIIKLESVDYNDTQIAKLESELKNINYRVEAYMLESVFLGGLAFSGFLTVAAANFLGKETQAFREFVDHFLKFIFACSSEHFSIWFNEIQNHFFRNDLYIVIMLLCLMASVFFLLVLTLRLRLNSLSLNMDHLIRIMTIFNAKEEELYNLQFQIKLDKIQTERLRKVGKKIDVALTDANKLLKELKPTVTMMSVYRNLALCLFYLVLIISGFYFMPIIATSILVLAVFTQVFRLLETYSKLGKIRELIQKH